MDKDVCRLRVNPSKPAGPACECTAVYNTRGVPHKLETRLNPEKFAPHLVTHMSNFDVDDHARGSTVASVVGVVNRDQDTNCIKDLAMNQFTWYGV